MFFDNSRPDRIKRANKTRAITGTRSLRSAAIPPIRSYVLMTYDELMSGNKTLICDTEVYKNYFLAGFKDIEADTFLFFELTPDGYFINGAKVTWDVWSQTLSFVMHRFLIIGFNLKGYDIPILAIALQGCPTDYIKEISNKIIVERMPVWRLEKELKAKLPFINFIDIMPVAPLSEGLKIYAGRLHCKRLQDLPYHHEKILTQEEAFNVKNYNVNDLDCTHRLMIELKPQIELRERMGAEIGLDIRSRSDAQAAKDYIVAKLRKRGVKVEHPKFADNYTFKYEPPAWVSFKTPLLQNVLDVIKSSTFGLNVSGHVDVPTEIKKLKIVIDGMRYKLALGGLHSTEKSVRYVSTDTVKITDRDVASYYPWLMIRNKWGPSHLGEIFFEIYENDLVLKRMQSKERIKQIYKELKGEANENFVAHLKAELGQCENIVNDLKVPLNGTFGNLIEQYGELYAPREGMHVTLTGQLGLLMQIEMLTEAGFKVISANTDGVVTLVPVERKAEYLELYKQWELITGLETEETEYVSINSRDVNNYIAVKTEGGKPDKRYLDERLGTKTKGIYCERGSALNSVLSKNPETLIVSDAMQMLLAKDIPIEETIHNCKDIRRFISIRKAEGGAEYKEEYLGKVVRWYYSTESKDTINTVKNANKIGKTEGAKPLMDLPDTLPSDLDYDWYINEAVKELYNIGFYAKAKTTDLFERF